MVRALDCGSSGWGFESPHSPQHIPNKEFRVCRLGFRIESISHRKLNSSLLTFNSKLFWIAPVAQLDRASASGAGGRRFESSQARFSHIMGR
jgi:hypothetical protein